MIPAVLTGCLVVLALAPFRLRPDHRLRDQSTPRRSRRRPNLRRRAPRGGPGALARWCDALARDVRSGDSLPKALRSQAPPTDTALGEIRRRLEQGAPLHEALAVPVTTADEHAVLTVLAACAHHGGPAAQPLDRAAAALRRRAADDAERAVHSAQARLSALVMTVLPGAVLVLLLTTSPPVRTTVRTPLGTSVVVLGLGLNAVGWWWMRRVISGGRR